MSKCKCWEIITRKDRISEQLENEEKIEYQSNLKMKGIKGDDHRHVEKV